MKKIVLILAALAVVSCRSVKYVEVPVIHQDTLYQSKVIRDSIHVHDSTIIERKGDTVFYDRWHTRWRERIRTDTVYQSKTDSVTVPVEIIKEVSTKPSWWQRTRMYIGDSFVLIILAGVILLVIKRKLL